MHVNRKDLEDNGITMDLLGGGFLVMYPKFDSDGKVVEVLAAFRNPDGRAAEVKMDYHHMTSGPYVDITLARGAPLEVRNSFARGEKTTLTRVPHFEIPNLAYAELGHTNHPRLVIDGLLWKVVARLA